MSSLTDVSAATTVSPFTASSLDISRQVASLRTSGFDSEGKHMPGDSSDVGLSQLPGCKSAAMDFLLNLSTQVLSTLSRFQELDLIDSDFLQKRRFGGNIARIVSSVCVVSAADVKLCESEERRDRGLACGRAFSDTRDRLLSVGVKYRLKASTKPRGVGRLAGATLSASGSGEVAEELWSSMSLDIRRERDVEATSDDDPTTASDWHESS